MRLIEKIKAEIERRKTHAETMRERGAYIDLLSFIESMEKETELPIDKDKCVPGKDYIPVEWVDLCEQFGKWKIVKCEQPEVDLEKAARHVYESWMGGTMDHVRRDMVTLGTVLNAKELVSRDKKLLELAKKQLIPEFTATHYKEVQQARKEGKAEAEYMMGQVEEVLLIMAEKGLIPFKDGNAWCILLGENLQEGVSGFGDTIIEAAMDFYRNYTDYAK